MDCEATHLWTFTGLVGAFLDLAIAYLLLCVSTLSFFTSKFLGIFGLCLPCPCNGLFGNPIGTNCVHRLLLECPTEQVSSIQLSVKNKFPFDLIWAKDQGHRHMNVKWDPERNSDMGPLEFERDVSCSSISDLRRSRNLSGKELVRRFDKKGKGAYGVRRRRISGVDSGNISSVSSYEAVRSGARLVPQSHISVTTRTGDEIDDESLEPANCGHDDCQCCREAPMVIGSGNRVSHLFEMSEPFDEDMLTEKETLPEEEFRFRKQRELHFDGDDENTIRVLELALEEEQAARTALYLELDKERSAAATAADEAMAMILRLQEEKASIEMEARQYHRMIEEKAAYDAEEMNILKEILLRREREKYFLEKEVEAYRQVIFEKRETDETVDSSFYSGEEDAVSMLQRVSESIDKKEKSKVASDQEFQEKGMVSENEKLFSENKEETFTPVYKSGSSQDESKLDRVHDVHVIDDDDDDVSRDRSGPLISPSVVTRTISDITSGLPPLGGGRGKLPLSDMRRNSMSAVDNERLKIDSEVGWLTEKLRIVQEGREKLNLSVGHAEREKIQLQLLEDIASQLREIRQLTEPGNTSRHSLPPPSSKAMSKKRRCRSVSLGLRQST